jgi:predicted DNA binding protein
MTVTADITVPADAFALGRVLEGVPEATVELERIVPLREAIIPLFWISGTDPDVIEATLRRESTVEAVEQLTTTDDETLFEVHWGPDIDGVVRALVETRAKVLEATGTAEVWEFRLRFGAHGDLSAFNVALTDDDSPVTLRHIYPTPPADRPELSAKHRETLLTAHRHGYFEVPRRTNLTELAASVGISDSALSQQIRRGLDALIEHTLLADERPRR